MNGALNRFLLGVPCVALATWAAAGSATVTGTSGLTVVTQSIGSSGWDVADSSAETATITYNDFVSVPTTSRNAGGTEFKCVENGVFGPKTLDGLTDSIADSFGGAGVSTSGYTTFSSPPPGVPQYFDTNWTSTATTSGQGAFASSGTYDPWSYTAGALGGFGLNAGTPIDIYFQVRLGAGSVALPNIDESAQFSFSAYATTWNSATIPFLSASVGRTLSGLSVQASQSSDPNVSIYQLPSTAALNDALDPIAKIGLGSLLGANGVQESVTNDLSGAGGMIDDLYFGVVVHNFVIPNGLGAGDTVFSTHLDTYAQVGPVPEPASILLLSGGFLAMVKRRRR